MATTSAHPTVTTTSEKARQKKSAFTALRWSILLVSLPFGILNFVLPVFGKQVGASALEIGLLFSSFSLMIVLLRPLVGAGLDRYGRKMFFVAGLGAYCAAMAAFALSTGVTGLVIARVLEGVASALLWLSANAIIADLAQADQRGSSFGNITQTANQGGMLGTFLGFTVLMSMGVRTGWGPLFLLFSAGALIAAAFAWWRMPETLPATVKETDQGKDSSVRPLLRSRMILALLLVTLVTAASWSMISPIMMIFLQEKLGAGFIDLAWAYFPAALVWATLPTRMGKLADRFGRKPLIVLSMAVAALSSFIIPGLGSLFALAGLLFIQAFCYAAGDPAEQALIADLTRENQRGRAFGLYALAGGIGSTIGPLAGGWLYDTAGQATPFIANGVVLAVCSVVLWIVLKENRSVEQD